MAFVLNQRTGTKYGFSCSGIDHQQEVVTRWGWVWWNVYNHSHKCVLHTPSPHPHCVSYASIRSYRAWSMWCTCWLCWRIYTAVPLTTSTLNDSYAYARSVTCSWPLTYLTGKTWGKTSAQSSILLVTSRTTLSTCPCLNLSTFVKTTCKQATVVALVISLVTQ